MMDFTSNLSSMGFIIRRWNFQTLLGIRISNTQTFEFWQHRWTTKAATSSTITARERSRYKCGWQSKFNHNFYTKCIKRRIPCTIQTHEKNKPCYEQEIQWRVCVCISARVSSFWLPVSLYIFLSLSIIIIVNNYMPCSTLHLSPPITSPEDNIKTQQDSNRSPSLCVCLCDGGEYFLDHIIHELNSAYDTHNCR